MRDETGRQRYNRQVEEIRDTLGVSHETARQRWRDYYTKGGRPIKKVKKLVLAVRASTTDQTICPFCRDKIYQPDDGGGQDHVCVCEAHYHLDCFEEELGGRCATIGCSARRAVSSVRARTRIRVRPQQTIDEALTMNSNWEFQAPESPQPLPTQIQAGSGEVVIEEAQEAADEPQEPELPFRIADPQSRLQEWLEDVWERLSTLHGSVAGIILALILLMFITAVKIVFL